MHDVLMHAHTYAHMHAGTRARMHARTRDAWQAFAWQALAEVTLESEKSTENDMMKAITWLQKAAEQVFSHSQAASTCMRTQDK